MFHLPFCARAQSTGLLCQFLLVLPYLSILDRRSLQSVSSFFTCWDFGLIGSWLPLDDSSTWPAVMVGIQAKRESATLKIPEGAVARVINCACLVTRDSHGWRPFKLCAKARLSVGKWKVGHFWPQYLQINVVILKKIYTCIDVSGNLRASLRIREKKPGY